MRSERITQKGENMKKGIVWLALLSGLVLGTTGGLFAAGPPASKAVAAVADITILDTDQDVDWTPILTAQLRTASVKDLFIDVSLECGLYTRTRVVSQDGVPDTSKAESGVRVQVILDPESATPRVIPPGEVTFCRRVQSLTGVYGGVENCEDENGDGIVQYDECETSPEETELLLDTMDANAFNFVVDDVGSGVHTIQVQAMIELEETAQAGEAEATAAIGNGAVTVEEVRMVNGADFEV